MKATQTLDQGLYGDDYIRSVLRGHGWQRPTQFEVAGLFFFKKKPTHDKYGADRVATFKSQPDNVLSIGWREHGAVNGLKFDWGAAHRNPAPSDKCGIISVGSTTV